ncbi:cyclin-A1-4 isoform X3 [Gossypium australe]|uniref:Cyclin-A1-4 isoform X3 n=1 Tax=Gossypium australe TaxID=47621 RepID=A0A5B6WET6_9ROSI|nr:cyclin-A1-4 isoform X3 [Gossypium australe]
MTAPTAKCFLRRFVLAAQGINEVSHKSCKALISLQKSNIVALFETMLKIILGIN